MLFRKDTILKMPIWLTTPIVCYVSEVESEMHILSNLPLTLLHLAIHRQNKNLIEITELFKMAKCNGKTVLKLCIHPCAYWFDLFLTSKVRRWLEVKESQHKLGGDKQYKAVQTIVSKA